MTVVDAPSTLRIVFLDDDEEFLETMRLWQDASGVQARATAEVETCVKWVGLGEVDIVVCDLRMGAENGVAILERLRRANASVELFLLTGYEPDGDERRRLERIGAKVVGKPDMADLLGHLAKGKEPAVGRQLINMQARIEFLEREHREWIRDLEAQLQAIPNADKAMVSSSEGPFTVADLLEDIRLHRPRGVEHVRLWRNALTTLRKLGKRV